MDPSLQAAITNSTVISEEMRTRLLKESPNLTPEQVQNMIQFLADAEQKAGAVKEDLSAKKREINAKYIADMKEFATHGFPQMMREAEEQDKSDEEAELDGILSELNNA